MWLFLFLCLIPTQLGKHFWPEWSYVLGIRVDYLSPTLYLLDLIWLGLFLVEFYINHKRIKFKKYLKFKYFLIIGLIILNILVAANLGVAIYKWLRLGQYLITFLYFQKNKTLVKEKLTKIIPGWIVLESLLSVAQIAKNGSINGLFYWLGERSFTFNTIGIAQVSVLGQGFIRAYGTFSHPNSLAGFLLVSLIFWYWLKDRTNKIWWWTILWLGLIGIIMSGSRTVWVLITALMVGIIMKKIKDKKSMVGLILLFLGVIIFGLRLINQEYLISDFLGGWDLYGMEKRIQLNLAGYKMIKESPWVGIGLGNFLVRLPEFQKSNGIFWLQPVHNILILAWSEIGILGLLLIFILLNKYLVWKKMNLISKIILGVVIISGMVDHYWFTLPQNVWLLVLVLGIA